MEVEHHYQLRVRYSETDQMGYVYYGNYASYFEVARVEALRTMGLSYHDLETVHHILLPVLRCDIRYLRPARYDDLLDIYTRFTRLDAEEVYTYTEVKCKAKLLAAGRVRLRYVSTESRRSTVLPQVVQDILGDYMISRDE